MNTTAAKANKANALIEELERLEVSEKLDDLAVRRLSREARSLMASDATGAHTVLGGIAGVEGDAAKVHEHYRAALQLSDRHPAVLSNYATALGRAANSTKRSQPSWMHTGVPRTMRACSATR